MSENWINRPARIEPAAMVELGENAVAVTDTKREITGFIRADFIALLHKGETIDTAHAKLWGQYVNLYSLRSVKSPKTREERADKTRYNTMYAGLDRVRKAFLPVTYCGHEIMSALDVSKLWIDAEFNGSMNFEIVLMNLANETARRNKIIAARVEQLEQAAAAAIRAAAVK